MNRFQFSENARKEMLSIAHSTMRRYIQTGEYTPDREMKVSKQLTIRTGLFVSVYVEHELRGCIGTFREEEQLFIVLQRMTLSAAFHDSRFAPVTAMEVEDAKVELSVLSPKIKISSPDEIQIGRHGIYIEKNANRGTLLPQVAVKNNWTPREFIDFCARYKAGISPDEIPESSLYIYEADVFGDL